MNKKSVTVSLYENIVIIFLFFLFKFLTFTSVVPLFFKNQVNLTSFNMFSFF